MKSTTDEVYCGRVKHENTNSDSAVIAKPYDIFVFNTCGKINMEKATNFKGRYKSQEKCQAKCDSVKSCRSYQWNGRQNKCTIIKYRIKEENLVEVPRTGKKSRVCAIMPKPGDTSKTEPPVVAPTLPPVAPTLSPVASPINTPVESPVAAPTDPPVAPTLPPVSPTLPPVAPTLPPVAPTLPPVAPTLPPVAPTEPPVAPTLPPVATTQPVECSLEVVLKYPFNDPDEANYYGYSTEYMVITETGIDDDIDDYYRYVCSGSESIYYPDSLPDWCEYENSSEEENVDGASIHNHDDYYYDYLDLLTQETITLSSAAGMSFDINVNKWFYDQDYYANYAGWEDHMLAAVLTVKNLSHGSQTDLNPDGWSKKVDMDTPTHIENTDGTWTVNEDHDDNFKVVVSCDDACLCEGTYFNDD